LLAALLGSTAAIPATADTLHPVVAEPEPRPADPASARYEIEGQVFALAGGFAEEPAAAGALATLIAGDPVFGDLDGDGDDDAVLWLIHQSGGSGTFYYVAAAYRESSGFRGTRAIFVADRIAPGALSIAHRLVTARYLARRPGEAMAVAPTIEAVSHFQPTVDGLRRVSTAPPETSLTHGWLVIGHEVRALTACGSAEPLWLSGDPSALSQLIQRYREALPGNAPGIPLFVTLVGRTAKPPHEGFGADYTGAYEVAEIVQIWPEGSCISDRIVVASPSPGANVRSPLLVRGSARGSWFFEGELRLSLLGAACNVLARGFATARSNWMTRDFVPFEGTLVFEAPNHPERGVLIVERNNPSENRALDEALELPISFE